MVLAVDVCKRQMTSPCSICIPSQHKKPEKGRMTAASQQDSQLQQQGKPILIHGSIFVKISRTFYRSISRRVPTFFWSTILMKLLDPMTMECLTLQLTSILWTSWEINMEDMPSKPTSMGPIKLISFYHLLALLSQSTVVDTSPFIIVSLAIIAAFLLFSMKLNFLAMKQCQWLLQNSRDYMQEFLLRNSLTLRNCIGNSLTIISLNALPISVS